MNISPEMQKSFTDEIYFVIERMKGTKNYTEKIYFFSAVYGQAQRIINFEYNPELLFIYQITQLVYNTINSRVSAITMGQDAGISIPDGLFDGLEGALKELADNITKGKESYSALQKMVNLAYTTTGNGYYMYLRGAIKV